MENDKTKPAEPAMGYRLAGRFLEACDCYAICPCWIDEVPDDEECTGLFVWDINAGEAMGHDVGGLRVASASFHQGKRSGARQKVVILIVLISLIPVAKQLWDARQERRRSEPVAR